MWNEKMMCDVQAIAYGIDGNVTLTLADGHVPNGKGVTQHFPLAKAIHVFACGKSPVTYAKRGGKWASIPAPKCP
jgi:hypothetical protein